MTQRTILLAWAESGGFAATHGAGASNEAIVDDLLAFLAREGVAIVPREPTMDMLGAGRRGPKGDVMYDRDCGATWRDMIEAAP